LFEDKNSFKNSVLDSIEANLLKDRFQLRNGNHTFFPPAIEYTETFPMHITKDGVKYNVPLLSDRKIQLNDRECQRLRILYNDVFFRQNKIYNFAFIHCPHIYKDSRFNDNLEILCYSLHEYRKWLKLYKITNSKKQNTISNLLGLKEFSNKTDLKKPDIEKLNAKEAIDASWHGKKSELLFIYDLLVGLSKPYVDHIKLISKSFKNDEGEQIIITSANVSDYLKFKQAPSDFCQLIRKEYEKI